MDKLIMTSSLWGVSYRHRYYLNGKRISADGFRRLFDCNASARLSGPDKRTSYGWRKEWQIPTITKELCIWN